MRSNRSAAASSCWPETPPLVHRTVSATRWRGRSPRAPGPASERWRDAHPEGTATYRDLAADPLPHLGPAAAQAGFVPPDQHNAEQAASWALSTELVEEVAAADTILLGLPVYNFGAPSTVKAWVDHLVAPGLSSDPATGDALLGGRELIVLEARGGGYGEGTPRDGWDHAQDWLPHGLSLTGLEPRFIVAELSAWASHRGPGWL